MNQKRIRAALYCRVSTDEQSCDMQLRDLKAYAEARGFSIVAEFQDVMSGAKEQRPQLNLLMDSARKRHFDCVLVWRFDRFARSTRHLLSALNEFRSLGIDFISYNENIDTSSPIGEALFTIIGAMATLERNIIAERVKGGLRATVAKGTKLGRPKRNLEAQIIALRKNGLTYSQIQEKLNTSPGSIARALQKPG